MCWLCLPGVSNSFRAPYEDDPLLVIDNHLSAYQASIPYIMSKANARNFSLVFDPRYQYADRSMRTALSDSTPQRFNASFIFRISEQEIRCEAVPLDDRIGHEQRQHCVDDVCKKY